MAPDDIKPGAGTGEEPDEAFEYVEEIVEYKDTRGLRTTLGIILVVLLLLLIGVGFVLWKTYRVTGGPSSAQTTKGMVWVRSIYGWGGTPDQQLVAPNAVAVASDGTIWSNSNNRTAVAFTAQGKLIRFLRSNPATSTSKPTSGTAPSHAGMPNSTRTTTKGVQAVYSLDVDPSGNLYVSDDANGNLLEFTPEGTLIQGWAIPGLSKIAVNGTNVAVLGKGNLGVFNRSTGAPVFAFGTRGRGTNQFDLPVGVHIDEKGFVYVADTQNQRVRKYTPAGRLVWDAGTVRKPQFQSHVEAPKGIFQLPTGVTTDANGRVEVIDAFNYQITVLDGATGKKIAAYGAYGQDDGFFDNPSAIAYDRANDYFVIGDTGNNRVQIVRLPGSGTVASGSLVRRALNNPAWVLCCPFLIILLAIVVTAVMSRRRRAKAEKEANAQAA
jgi:sugar lactone lactonase YvrE